MIEDDIQLAICLNTMDYVNKQVQALMKNPVDSKIYYTKNIYYQYVFLSDNNDTNKGIFVPAIFLEKNNKYVAAVYFNPITGWDWLVQEDYRGQHILSNFLRDDFTKLRLRILKEIKESGIKLHPQFQGDLSRLFIEIIDNPNEDLLNKRIHLAELAKLEICNTKEIEIYKKYWDSNKTLEELRKLKLVNF